MDRRKLEFAEGFQVVMGNAESQAAVMVLGVGESIGSRENRHESSDQWLYVVRGAGTAVVESEGYDLTPGTLLFIERGEAHEIKNTAAEPLQTLNFYVPPAY